MAAAPKVPGYILVLILLYTLSSNETIIDSHSCSILPHNQARQWSLYRLSIIDSWGVVVRTNVVQQLVPIKQVLFSTKAKFLSK